MQRIFSNCCMCSFKIGDLSIQFRGHTMTYLRNLNFVMQQYENYLLFLYYVVSYDLCILVCLILELSVCGVMFGQPSLVNIMKSCIQWKKRECLIYPMSCTSFVCTMQFFHGWNWTWRASRGAGTTIRSEQREIFHQNSFGTSEWYRHQWMSQI